ncbi:MAG: hypothetical protein WBG08_01450, partial [Litorimonas sp.]
MMFRAFLASALLAGLASAPSVASASAFESDRSRMLGDYLSGSYARYLNDPRAQSRYFQDAFGLAPDDTRLGRMALYSALFSGDPELARETAQRLYREDRTEAMARAVLAVDAFSKGRSARVRKYASEPTQDVTMGLAMQVLLGWTQVDEGQYERARETFSGMTQSAYFSALGQLQIAKLEARLGNREAAEAAFDRVEATGIAPLEYGLSRA